MAAAVAMMAVPRAPAASIGSGLASRCAPPRLKQAAAHEPAEEGGVGHADQELAGVDALDLAAVGGAVDAQVDGLQEGGAEAAGERRAAGGVEGVGLEGVEGGGAEGGGDRAVGGGAGEGEGQVFDTHVGSLVEGPG